MIIEVDENMSKIICNCINNERECVTREDLLNF